jgi:hypothetical protein
MGILANRTGCDARRRVRRSVSTASRSQRSSAPVLAAKNTFILGKYLVPMERKASPQEACGKAFCCVPVAPALHQDNEHIFLLNSKAAVQEGFFRTATFTIFCLLPGCGAKLTVPQERIVVELRKTLCWPLMNSSQ